MTMPKIITVETPPKFNPETLEATDNGSQIYHIGASRFEVVDRCMLVFAADGERLCAAYAEGEWSRAILGGPKMKEETDENEPSTRH